MNLLNFIKKLLYIKINSIKLNLVINDIYYVV